MKRVSHFAAAIFKYLYKVMQNKWKTNTCLREEYFILEAKKEENLQKKKKKLKKGNWTKRNEHIKNKSLYNEGQKKISITLILNHNYYN